MGYKTPKKNRIYHIYDRGNRRSKIGREAKDFDLLFGLVKDIFNVKNYELLCFCLMPNHYHVLVSQTGNRTISYAMHLIKSEYAKYFNTKYGLTGHLFQGIYNRKWVIGDDAVILTYAYIINNPNKIKLRSFSDYPWIYRNDFLLENILARRSLNRE